MKRVVFLIAHLGDGGAERVTALLVNYFVKHGYDIELIVFSKKYNEYEIDSEIKLHYLPSKPSKVEDVAVKVVELRRLLKTIQPDYVVSLGFSYRFLFFGYLMKKYKFILSERNAPQFQNSSWYDMAIAKYCLKNAVSVVFQTEEARDFYESVIQQKSVVIPNPIKPDLPESYLGNIEKRVIAVCRLNKQKNIPLLFRAFKKLIAEFSEYILEIYGRGELEDELINYAKTLQISENVKFMGIYPDIHNRILSACMFVSSSDYEGISNSMLESLALGLPCVCTDCPVGGAREFIIDGVNGLLVPTGDENALYLAMKKIIENPDKTTKMLQSAKAIRNRLAVDNIGQMWMELMP
jgi:GalNAc-alpha-(1->4)-GalNAc-alpha-(1->3)-diNAcBac-PP-undecaprenol alpha-1,4-N-acetyl-D-galactosaminyltransferase